MILTEINSDERFSSLKDIWNQVLEKNNFGTIFSTFEWLNTWWECFGQDNKLFILLAQDKEEIIGIAPLMIEQRKILRCVPIKAISFIGTGISDYADFIIKVERKAVLNSFFKYIWKNKHLWDEIDLREIREDSSNLEMIRDILKNGPCSYEISCLGKCPYIPIRGDWDSFYSSLSKSFRQDIRTQYNRLKKNGSRYGFSHVQDHIDDAFLSQLIVMHLDSINLKNKKSFLESKEGKSFFKRIIEGYRKKGKVVINIMKVGYEIAAYFVGFLFQGRYYYWNVGKNDKYDDFSPGKLLLQNMIMECFSNNTIKEFDFLRGEEEYKYRWTKMERKNYRVHIRNNTLKTKLLCKVQDALHAVRNNS